MKRTPIQRSTQSICVTPAEWEAVNASAKAAGLSVSSWGYSRVMAALASKATRAGALDDLGRLELGSSRERTRRVSVIMSVPDYAALKSCAGSSGVSAHAWAQAVLITDATRAAGLAPRAMVERDARRRAGSEPGEAPASLPGEAVTLVPVSYFMAPDAAELREPVARMVRAMGTALWPDRDKPTPGDAASYAATVANRSHVRVGMLRVLAKHPRSPDHEQTVPVAFDARELEWLAAALAMPRGEVARAIVLRCLSDAEAERRRRVAASSVDDLVADALAPIEVAPLTHP